jgi:hypothetical protein
MEFGRPVGAAELLPPCQKLVRTNIPGRVGATADNDKRDVIVKYPVALGTGMNKAAGSRMSSIT